MSELLIGNMVELWLVVAAVFDALLPLLPIYLFHSTLTSALWLRSIVPVDTRPLSQCFEHSSVIVVQIMLVIGVCEIMLFRAPPGYCYLLSATACVISIHQIPAHVVTCRWQDLLCSLGWILLGFHHLFQWSWCHHHPNHCWRWIFLHCIHLPFLLRVKLSDLVACLRHGVICFNKVSALLMVLHGNHSSAISWPCC